MTCSVSTKLMTGSHRQLRDGRARPQLQVDHVAVGRRVVRRLTELPLRVLQLRENLRHVRLLVPVPGVDLLAQAGGLRTVRGDLLLGAGELRQQRAKVRSLLRRVGLPPLRLELIAGTRFRQLLGLTGTQFCQPQAHLPGLDRALDRLHAVERHVDLRLRGFRVFTLGAHVGPRRRHAAPPGDRPRTGMGADRSGTARRLS